MSFVNNPGISNQPTLAEIISVEKMQKFFFKRMHSINWKVNNGSFTFPYDFMNGFGSIMKVRYLYAVKMFFVVAEAKLSLILTQTSLREKEELLHCV